MTMLTKTGSKPKARTASKPGQAKGPRRGQSPRTYRQAAPRTNPRACAAQVLAAVFNGRSLTEVLQTSPCVAAHAPFIQALCYGLLREYPRPRYLLDAMLDKPLKPQDLDLQALLMAGIYQLEAMSAPAHAVVNESAQACRFLGKPWAVKLVNALLRRYQREAENLKAIWHEQPEYRHAMPLWLLERLQEDWPDQWQDICIALGHQAPLTLRVNQGCTSLGDYLALLKSEGLSASPHPWVESALILDQALPVEHLPGFFEGLVSVQDAGAQLAARLLDPAPAERLLDACAAPGGKTGHLLEWGGPGLVVTAIDRDAKRLLRVKENLERLGLQAQCFEGDATRPEGAWASASYDAILLDAPCSATGVINRHPDIKLLRRDTDITALAQVQATSLRALWPLLVPGGRLLYATCSLLKAENEAIVRDFLAEEPSARERPLQLAAGRAMGHGWQLLPGEGRTDGFYYALLEKTA